MGLGISRTNADSQWIQFIRRFIEFVWVETNQFVSSNFKMIWTLQTCGQGSSRVAGSKRQVLDFVVLATSQCCRLSGGWHAFDPIQETQNSSTQITEQ